MSDRVFIFIDGSNLEIAVKHAFRKRVLPEPLAYKLVGKRRLMRVNYYESPLLSDVNQQTYDEQQSFFNKLRQNPHFEIRLGRRVKRDKNYECPNCHETFTITAYEQKGVDSLMVLDLVTLAMRNAYDIAVLVTGDQDFVSSISEVKMMEKQVENAFTNYGWSPVLRNVVDKTILLNKEFLKDCW